MICPNCQKEIADGSNFCYNCGARQATNPPPPAYGSYASGYPHRRLVRSINDRKVAGVCAGVAEYFDMDPTLVRILWLLLLFCAGLPGIAYIVCWIVLPEGYTGVAPSSQTAP
jgi:phage shock protein C